MLEVSGFGDSGFRLLRCRGFRVSGFGVSGS